MLLYNICISIYSQLIRLAAIKIPKAKLWSDGRNDIFNRLQEAINPTDRVIWIHVASLGEFEQGRPLIERLRETHPEFKILLTFFSPSGYEVRKNYDKADYIFYLPIDTTSNARRFLDIAHPEIAIFVKYEFWINLLFELRNRNIKSYIISAIFRRNSIFFKPWGAKWRRALESFDTLFVQDNNSKELLATLGFDNVVVAGDTRFDRVADIAKNTNKIPTIELFKGDKKLLVAGSTWSPDEDILKDLVEKNRDIKFIIAPHEVNDVNVRRIMEMYGDQAIRYTTAKESELKGAQIMILDTIGVLSSSYQYGEFAYIGGGFGVGIHNTLEAATFAIPVAFGPNYKKFKEATDMISLGACCSVSNSNELCGWLSTLLNSDELYNKKCRTAREYTSNQRGATSIIARTIFCE
ncbi:MAG: glycosyltransferase N-terminal domain-containing protein [Rikenellaceae bacterium]